MRYRVIRDFSDSMDNGYVYRAGDVFPRPEIQVGEDRIADLLGTGNKRGVPLIEEGSRKPEEGIRDTGTDERPPVASEGKKKPRKK